MNNAVTIRFLYSKHEPFDTRLHQCGQIRGQEHQPEGYKIAPIIKKALGSHTGYERLRNSMVSPKNKAWVNIGNAPAV